MKLVENSAILECIDCKHEFFYEKKFMTYAGNPDDYLIECPGCENWEQVGNDRPSSFRIRAQTGEEVTAYCSKILRI